jgi:thermitase
MADAYGHRLVRGFGRGCIASALLLAALLPGATNAAPTPASSSTGTTLLSTTTEPFPYVEAPSQIGLTTPKRMLRTAPSSLGVRVVADRIVLSVQPGLTDADLAAINTAAARLGAGAANPVLRLPDGTYLVDVTGATSTEAAAQAYLKADKRVVSASPDSIMRTTASPDDPLLSQMPNLPQIEAFSAWSRHRGDGVKIAVLDTGMNESHPDLIGKVDDHANLMWFSSGAGDQFGHGTHVAGIAAATGNNTEGIAGLAMNARLMNGKIADDDGSVSAVSMTSGIYWAVDHGANVINISAGATRDCSGTWIENWTDTGVAALRRAIDYAWQHNVVLVASAGNDGTTNKLYPAACPHVLAVGAVDQNDVRASTSTHGTWVQVAAPGVNILSSAVPGAPACFNNPIGVYAHCDGTSMAAPQVAGLAALVRASCGLTSAQAIVDRITSTTDAFVGGGSDWQFGRVNARKAVCIPSPGGLAVKSATDTSISFIWLDRSPFETSFHFRYRPTGSTSQGTLVTLPANTTSYTVTNLSPGVSYDFTVQACDSLGCSALSNLVTARANFYRLNTTMQGTGRITSTPTGIDCSPSGPTCGAYFQADSTVALFALGGVNPNTHVEYDFDHWEGACTGVSPVCSVPMNDPLGKTAKAVFIAVGNDL